MKNKYYMFYPINLVVKKINSGYIIDNYIVVSEKELFNKKE